MFGFYVLVSKVILMLQFLMCLYKGVFDVLLKHVEQFGMNLMHIKDSKTLLKHHNLFFASFLFLIF